MTAVETGIFTESHYWHPYVVQYDDPTRHFKFHDNEWWRSTNGGASFANQGAIWSDAGGDFGTTCWYGRWNVSGPTDLIYLLGMVHDAGGTNFRIYFRTFDPSTETFGTQITVFTSASLASGIGASAYRINVPGVNNGHWLAICRTEDTGGLELVAYWTHRGQASIGQTLRSTDGGATWNTTGQPTGASGSTSNRVSILPNLFSADPSDLYAFVNDIFNNEFRLYEYDWSAGTWASVGQIESYGVLENADQIRGDAVFDRATGDLYFHVTSDGGLSAYAGTGISQEIWRYDGATLAMQSAFRSGENGSMCAGLYISPVTGALFAAFAPENSLDQSVEYRVSTDQGVTFSGSTVIEADADGTAGRLASIGFIPAYASDALQPYVWWRMELGNGSHNTPEVLITAEEAPEPTPEPVPGVPAFLLCDFGYEFDEIIDPAGNVFRLSDGVSKFLTIEAGTGIPPIEYLTQRAPYLHGEQLFDYRLGPRSVRQRYRWRGRGRRDRWGLYGFLLDAIRPNRQVAPILVVEPLRLRKYLPDGSRWDLNVFPDLAALGQRERGGVWDEWSLDEPIRFIAHDPVYYDPDTTVAILADDDEQLVFADTDGNPAGGVDFEPGERIYFGGGLQALVVYDGNWYAEPVIEIMGPITDPIITNDAIQEQIGLDYALEAGEVVTIDTRERTRSIVSGLVGSITGLVTNPSSLATFRLVPDPTAPDGENPIRLFGTDQVDGLTGVTVRYQRRKIALGQ